MLCVPMHMSPRWLAFCSLLTCYSCAPLPVREAPVLAVYYGFPRWLEAMHGKEPWYRPWREHIEELLRQPGVTAHGMVDHTAIAHAYAASGFYLFPSDKPETSGGNRLPPEMKHSRRISRRPSTEKSLRAKHSP